MHTPTPQTKPQAWLLYRRAPVPTNILATPPISFHRHQTCQNGPELSQTVGAVLLLQCTLQRARRRMRVPTLHQGKGTWLFVGACARAHAEHTVSRNPIGQLCEHLCRETSKHAVDNTDLLISTPEYSTGMMLMCGGHRAAARSCASRMRWISGHSSAGGTMHNAVYVAVGLNVPF